MPWVCNPPPIEVLQDVLDADTAHELTPEEFWSNLRPRLDEFGISRLADITGLDRIGFPVVQAIRPLARSNAVTQGKAATMSGAAVGAVLESLEMAAGEDMARFASVPGDGALWSPLAPGLEDGSIWPDAATSYVGAWNLGENVASALPRDLISTDFTRNAPAAKAPILRHSIGLGAGTNLASAVLHGLLECIEADARCHSEATGHLHPVRIVQDDPVYGAIARQIQAAGLRIRVQAMPNNSGVIAVKASIMEAPGATALPLPATGFAARQTASAAIAAALAEAVQARLAVIAGAREDITQRFYKHGFTLAEIEAEWARHKETPLVGDCPDTTCISLREIACRVGPVCALPLHWDADLPLAIVRVVAPDLIADPLRLVPT
ncbi:YcaO-like family protein [Sulfitobacter sp. F26204]|uniref:YcaO-like family protein n=1 Tax=Sulfitobacter sp. F26204 TaxID=2996014 RepID=UPI00225DD6F8|nr:YcaO-like family protein [Sulfitobacter sp. F26204]MCX7559238.1 YcaO-like family protein [Sulfitobacter sp. F26204]